MRFFHLLYGNIKKRLYIVFFLHQKNFQSQSQKVKMQNSLHEALMHKTTQKFEKKFLGFSKMDIFKMSKMTI